MGRSKSVKKKGKEDAEAKEETAELAVKDVKEMTMY